MKRDPVGVVEAAYALEGDDRVWLGRVCAAAALELDRGHGLLGCLRGPDPWTSTVRSDDLHRHGCSDEFVEVFLATSRIFATSAWYRKATEQFSWHQLPRVYGTMSELWGRHFPTMPYLRDRLEPTGVRDLLSLSTVDPSQGGCLINVGLPRIARSSPRTVARWTRILAHVAAGLRLRRAIASTNGDAFTGADAILGADGKCHHAEPVATSKGVRHGLQRGAARIDRARGELRRADPDHALDIWRGLVEGRWSLVDHIDRDGKRFFIARRNDPTARPVGPLTLPERQVAFYAALGHTRKLIAYELGLGEAAVTMSLQRAARKLGVRSRMALLRRLRELLFTTPPPAPDVKK